MIYTSVSVHVHVDQEFHLVDRHVTLICAVHYKTMQTYM